MIDLDKMGIVAFIGKRYGTFNPFGIADKLNIPIMWVDLGSNLMGKVTYLKGNPIILLNVVFKELNSRYFYCAHEVSHVIRHEGLSGAYNLNTKFRDKFEYQATEFADYILINLYREDFGKLPDTYHDVEAEYGIPEQ